MGTTTKHTISTEVSPNVVSRFEAQLNTLSHKSNKPFHYRNKKFFALCYLNKSSLYCDSKYWQIANIYDHYSTKDELQKTSLLGTGTDYGNRLIDIIADPSKHIARLVYSEDENDWRKRFFEVSVWDFKYGENINMNDYAITDYCDMMKDEHIVINLSNK